MGQFVSIILYKSQVGYWQEAKAHFDSEVGLFNGSADLWRVYGINQSINQASPQDVDPIVHSTKDLLTTALWIGAPDVLLSPAHQQESNSAAFGMAMREGWCEQSREHLV